MAERIGKFSSAACGGPPTNPPWPCLVGHRWGKKISAVEKEGYHPGYCSTRSHHEAHSEREPSEHTSGSPVGVAPVFCMSARRKTFAARPARRALFSYVSQTACLDF